VERCGVGVEWWRIERGGVHDSEQFSAYGLEMAASFPFRDENRLGIHDSFPWAAKETWYEIQLNST
jgi:hypothetical protein